MVAEELLKNPTLFSGVQNAPHSSLQHSITMLAKYLEILDDLNSRAISDDRGIYLEDDNVEGNTEIEFERMSVWWSNAAVVIHHVKNIVCRLSILEQTGIFYVIKVRRNNRKKRKTVAEILDSIRRFVEKNKMDERGSITPFSLLP